MSKETLWIIIVIIALALLAAGYLYWKKQQVTSQEELLREQQQTLEEFQQALEQASTGAPEVEVPSANPLDEITVNPIERANPFKNVYQNPFQ